MALAVAEQAVNMKRRHIRYAQAGIHRNRDKIRKIVASRFVPVIDGFAQGRPVVTQTLLLAVIYVAVATLVHSGIVALGGALQSTVASTGSRRAIRRGLALALVAIAVWFALTTGRVG